MARWSRLTLYTFLYLWIMSATAQSQPPQAGSVDVNPDTQQKFLGLLSDDDEAKILHREASEIKIRLHTPEPPHEVIILSSLTEIFGYSDLDIEVTVMQIRALYPADEIWTLSTLRRRTFVTRHNRAYRLGFFGHPDQAVEILTRVVQELEDLQVKGIKSEEGRDFVALRLHSMENLASNLAKMGQTDEAVKLYQKVAKEATDPRTKGRVLISSGYELRKLEKLTEAANAITEGLKLRLAAGPVRESDKKRYVGEIQDILRKQGKTQEAEDFDIDALVVGQK